MKTHDVTGPVRTSSDVTQAQAFYIETALDVDRQQVNMEWNTEPNTEYTGHRRTWTYKKTIERSSSVTTCSYSIYILFYLSIYLSIYRQWPNSPYLRGVAHSWQTHSHTIYSFSIKNLLSPESARGHLSLPHRAGHTLHITR